MRLRLRFPAFYSSGWATACKDVNVQVSKPIRPLLVRRGMARDLKMSEESLLLDLLLLYSSFYFLQVHNSANERGADVNLLPSLFL